MSLRSELTRITDELDVNKHREQLIELRATHPHTIEIVEAVDPDDDFNCVMFALDLVGSIEPPCTPLGRYYLDTEFLEHLIRERTLVSLDASEAEALVIYLANGAVKHAGVVLEGGRVRSKWGCGHLYEHEAWEVPESIGDEIRYFRPIDPDKAFALFKVFKGWDH